MLKIFYELGDKDNIESNLIAEASNRLDLGEFQLFQLAYEAWHGKEIPPQQLEAIFFDYLMKSKIPPWARHYARKIIAQDDAGALDYRDPLYHRFDPSSMRAESRRSGILKVAAVLFVFAVFFGVSLILLDGINKDDFPCHFPPCYLSQ